MQAGEPKRDLESIQLRLEIVKSAKELQAKQPEIQVCDPEQFLEVVMRGQFIAAERAVLKKDLLWLSERLIKSPGVNVLPASEAWHTWTLMNEIIKVL